MPSLYNNPPVNKLLYYKELTFVDMLWTTFCTVGGLQKRQNKLLSYNKLFLSLSRKGMFPGTTETIKAQDIVTELSRKGMFPGTTETVYEYLKIFLIIPKGYVPGDY